MGERIAIGKIVSPHGIKGEIKVFPWTDNPERFRQLTEVWIVHGETLRKIHITGARQQRNGLILAARELQTADQAEAVRNWTIEIEKEDLPVLPEGSFYIFDLIGLQVSTLSGEELGLVADVLQTGANDVYVVKNPQGKEVLIPALKSVVVEVDFARRKMVVNPLPGLLTD